MLNDIQDVASLNIPTEYRYPECICPSKGEPLFFGRPPPFGVGKRNNLVNQRGISGLLKRSRPCSKTVGVSGSLFGAGATAVRSLMSRSSNASTKHLASALRR